MDVVCAGDEAAVHRAIAVTGAEGATPVDVEKGAILITKRRLRPSDDPAKPAITDYSYIVHVRATGYKPAQLALDSRAGIPRPLPVVLEAGR